MLPEMNDKEADIEGIIQKALADGELLFHPSYRERKNTRLR